MEESKAYTDPISNNVFKYLLSDPVICSSLLKSLTLKPYDSIRIIDNSPSQRYLKIQEFINDSRYKNFMEEINSINTDGGQITINDDFNLKDLTNILDSFNTPNQDSVFNILCDFSDDFLTIVEIQVTDKHFDGHEALSHAFSVYEREMRKSKYSSEIRGIICINIIKDLSGTPLHFKHFALKDQYNRSRYIEFFEYPIYATDIIEQASKAIFDDDQQLELKEWIDFLAHAFDKKETDIEEIKTEAVKMAYEKINVQALHRR